MEKSFISKMDISSQQCLKPDSSTFGTNPYMFSKKTGAGNTKKTMDTFDTKQTLFTVFDNEVRKRQAPLTIKEQVNTTHQAVTQQAVKKSKSTRRMI